MVVCVAAIGYQCVICHFFLVQAFTDLCMPNVLVKVVCMLHLHMFFSRMCVLRVFDFVVLCILISCQPTFAILIFNQRLFLLFVAVFDNHILFSCFPNSFCGWCVCFL